MLSHHISRGLDSEQIRAQPDGTLNRSDAEYREYPAPITLQSYLMCVWTQSVGRSRIPYAHRVLPDACIDVVFINDEPPVVVGPYVQSFIATLPIGTNIVGARFHPGCATGFLGHPASALLNRSVPLDALWNKAVCSHFVSPVYEAICLADRLAGLEKTMLTRLPRVGPIDPVVGAAIRRLADHAETRVEHLSAWIGMSSRQLWRRFSNAIGYSLKTFQEVLRFQRLLHLAADVTPRPRLADLAATAGYADQAHMTREVRRFSDLPPMDLLGGARCTLGLSGLIPECKLQRK